MPGPLEVFLRNPNPTIELVQANSFCLGDMGVDDRILNGNKIDTWLPANGHYRQIDLSLERDGQVKLLSGIDYRPFTNLNPAESLTTKMEFDHKMDELGLKTYFIALPEIAGDIVSYHTYYIAMKDNDWNAYVDYEHEFRRFHWMHEVDVVQNRPLYMAMEGVSPYLLAAANIRSSKAKFNAHANDEGALVCDLIIQFKNFNDKKKTEDAGAVENKGAPTLEVDIVSEDDPHLYDLKSALKGVSEISASTSSTMNTEATIQIPMYPFKPFDFSNDDPSNYEFDKLTLPPVEGMNGKKGRTIPYIKPKASSDERGNPRLILEQHGYIDISPLLETVMGWNEGSVFISPYVAFTAIHELIEWKDSYTYRLSHIDDALHASKEKD